jgi:hypothetical protein
MQSDIQLDASGCLKVLGIRSQLWHQGAEFVNESQKLLPRATKMSPKALVLVIAKRITKPADATLNIVIEVLYSLGEPREITCEGTQSVGICVGLIWIAHLHSLFG